MSMILGNLRIGEWRNVERSVVDGTCLDVQRKCLQGAFGLARNNRGDELKTNTVSVSPLPVE